MSARDITESKRIEAALRVSEERYRHLVEEIGDVIYSVDTEGVITYVSPAIESVLGYRREEIIGRSMYELFPPEDIARVRASAAAPSGGRQEPAEWQMKTKSGGLRWVQVSSRRIIDGDEVTGLRGVLTDISARKEAEEQAERTSQFLQTIYDNSDVGTFVVDVTEDGDYVYSGINPAHEKLSGMTNEQVVGKSPQDLQAHFGAETLHYILSLYDQCVAERRLIESEGTGVIDGREEYWLSRLTPLMDEHGHVYRLIGNGIIITERKRMESQLAEAQRRQDDAVRAANVGLWDWDLKTDRVHYSSEWKEQIGYGADELTDSLEEWRSRVHAEDQERVLGEVQACIQEQLQDFSTQFRLRHRDGSYRWILAQASVGQSADGALHMRGSHVDITSHKEAESELRRTQELRAALIENADGMMWSVDSDYCLVVGNTAFEEATRLGQSQPLAAGESVLDERFSPEAVREWRGYYDRALAGESFSLQMPRRLGDQPPMIEYRFSPIHSGGDVTGVVVFGRDVSERHRLQQRAIHLERMRAAGELAAGVSHNLNNMLTAVLAPAQILMRKSDDQRILTEAETIFKAGQRARELVSKLNQAVRSGQQETHGGVSLEHEITQIVELSRPRWRDEPQARGVAIDVATCLESTPMVRANAGELGDIVLNLILNAVEAMPDGGQITVTTSPDSGGAKLQVRDTGTGMDENTRRRVFEPFFTTKADVGTGLGLATVHGAVTRWGGTVAVESAVGEGTTFSLWFPAFLDQDAEAPTPSPGSPGALHGSMLVVDDDAQVCDVLERVFRDAHQVIVVHNGSEAVESFTSGRYSVALIDLGIPGMAGDEVAARIRALDPALATVLVTGWELDAEDPRLLAFDARIAKPFEDLDRVVSEVARAMALTRRRRQEHLPKDGSGRA